MYPGGNALNFAAYAAMLGHNAAYLGIFGNDAAAEHVMQVLDKVGVKWPHCLQVAGENGCAQLKIEEGERIFLGSTPGVFARQLRWILFFSMSNTCVSLI